MWRALKARSAGGPGQRPGGGPVGQTPVSSEDPAVEKAKKRSKPDSLYQQIWKMDPSHDTAIKGSKRGQEGITNEAIFQFRYFFAQVQSFINFSDWMHRTCNLDKFCLFNGYCYGLK